MRVELRPTEPDDIARFIGKTIPYRARALTAWRGDEILGIGGVAMLPDGTALAFLHLAEGARRYAVALHKAALRTIAEARARGVRKIVAQADMSIPAAERWLARLGFEPVMVGDERVWVWQL